MANNLLGLTLGNNISLLNKDFALDKSTGKILNIAEALSRVTPSQSTIGEDAVIKKEVEVVSGIDKQKIELTLKTSEGLVENTGFLIEVYLSGTDGKLTRVYQEDVVDVLNDETLSEGFSNYLILDVDVDG